MSQITEKFERNFAKYVGSKYAVMVNSGSSANLLSAFALSNPKKENSLSNLYFSFEVRFFEKIALELLLNWINIFGIILIIFCFLFSK